MIMGNAIWQLIAQSDAVSKFVLLVLLGMSIACWTVFLYKLVLLRLKKRHMDKALDLIKAMRTLDDMLVVATQLHNTMPGYFLSKNLSFLKSMIELNKERGRTELSQQDFELFQQHMYQTVDDMVYSDEAYVPLLSTCAAVSPLLGLFGTVWGLVHSFVRISEKQSADIATVAPGIAEALITTLVGLIVAIPALIMFNYIQVRVRELEQHYNALADRVGFTIQRLLLK
ncbi:MAG: MotA/TolQ/ExbB proton channel family protein [Candidatus Dependentiae bacterium]|nr:MotA/TolQ/ExbB proton channel family protein [Candidatus Dependentiae bacterium]